MRAAPILTAMWFAVAICPTSRIAHAQTKPAAGPEVYKLTLRANPPMPADRLLRFRLTIPNEELTAGNGAPVYMAAMLVLANQSPEWTERLERLQALPMDQLPRDEAAAVVKEAASILAQLHVAARRDTCDWELPRREHGAQALLPHVHRMRTLVRLLSLNTRLALLDGRYDDAFSSMQTTAALIRHGQDERQGILLDALVSAMCGRFLLDDVAAAMGSEQMPNLYWSVATLPRPLLDVPGAIRREVAYVYYAFPALADPRKSGLTDAQWHQILIDVLRDLNPDPPSPDELDKLRKRIAEINASLLPKAKAMPGAKDATDAQAIAMYAVAEMERARDERERWFSLPFWQGHRGLLETDRALHAAQAKDPNPLISMEPNTATWYRRLIHPDRRAAALMTIEAIRAHGKVPAKLADAALPLPIDPATGSPMLYEPREGGFTLTSRIEGGEPQDEIRYEVTLK